MVPIQGPFGRRLPMPRYCCVRRNCSRTLRLFPPITRNQIQRLFAVKPSETIKLTLALGKLMVRKAAIATDLNRLTRSYSKDHPEVKRAAKKLEIFESAVKDILR